MQNFIINKDSVLPTLRMELIYDGRSDYNKFFDAIQDSEITFTMTNVDTNVTKIANAPCYIKKKEGDGCVAEYVICYDWKKRDTKEKGVFEGEFNIHFNGNIISETTTYPVGDLKMPIREKLLITVQ
jgi:hypothetical protein